MEGAVLGSCLQVTAASLTAVRARASLCVSTPAQVKRLKTADPGCHTGQVDGAGTQAGVGASAAES